MARNSKRQPLSLQRLNTTTVALVLLALPFHLLFDIPATTGLLWGWWALAVLSAAGIWWSEK